MKTKYLLLFLLSVLFVSCGEDRRKEYAPRVNANKWMEEVMRNNYLWFEDIPEEDKLRFYSIPSVFFPTLLSSKDGKGSGNRFSTMIDFSEAGITPRSAEETSYGMEVLFHKNPKNTNTYFARVLYTLEDSPAADAGLKRGDWIFSVNNAPINANNMTSLITGSDSITVETGIVDDELIPLNTISRWIPAARLVINRPVYYYTAYERGNKKIGYVVYNSFVTGEGEDKRYLDELRDISNEFKANNVTEMILDLRYNPGGELNRPVPLICSMLAPASAMGNLMGTIKYNALNEDKNWTISFLPEHLNGGANLDLERIYILTSNITASASEAVINFLDPYMEVIQIGTKTVGKNVGSEMITSDEFPSLRLQPIVCRIYNAEDLSEYDSGFTPEPGKVVDESQIYTEMRQLGDPEELLLATALSLIDGTYVAPESLKKRSIFETPGSSLERKSLPGVLIFK